MEALAAVKADPMARHSIAVWDMVNAALAMPPEAPLPATMQDVVDQLGITPEDAAGMIRHGFEMMAAGTRLYSAFLFGEVRP